MAFVQEVMRASWRTHHFVEYYLRRALGASRMMNFDSEGHVYVVGSSFEESVSDTVRAYNSALSMLEEDRNYGFVLNGMYQVLNENIFEQTQKKIPRAQYFTDGKVSELSRDMGFEKSDFPRLYLLLVRNGLFLRQLVALKEQLSFMSLEKNVEKVLHGADELLLREEQGDEARRKAMDSFYVSFRKKCFETGWAMVTLSRRTADFWIPFFLTMGFCFRSVFSSSPGDSEESSLFVFTREPSSDGSYDEKWGIDHFVRDPSLRKEFEKVVRVMEGKE